MTSARNLQFVWTGHPPERWQSLWREVATIAQREGASLSEQVASSGAAERAFLERGGVDAVIAFRPWDSALSLLRKGAIGAGPAAIFVGDPDGVDAANALRWGAHEVLAADESDAGRVWRAIRHALERAVWRAGVAERHARLEQLALMDGLTDTYNRFGCEKFLRVELARSRRNGLPLHVALLDVDDFKNINDVYGHARGDLALVEVARRVVASVRAQDCVARIGGDEFAVLLPETRLAEALAVAERVRRAVSERPFEVQPGQFIPLTVSLGVVGVDGAATNVTSLLEGAGAALKLSKTGGKNRVRAAKQDGQQPVGEAPQADHEFEWRAHPLLELPELRQVGTEWVAYHSASARSHLDVLARTEVNEDERARRDLDCLDRALALACADEQSGVCVVRCLPCTFLRATRTDVVARLSPWLGKARGELYVALSDQRLTGDPRALASAIAPLRQRGLKLILDDVGFVRSSLESVIALEPEVVRLHERVVAGGNVAVQSPVLGRLAQSLTALGVKLAVQGVPAETERARLRAEGIVYASGEAASSFPAPLQVNLAGVGG